MAYVVFGGGLLALAISSAPVKAGKTSAARYFDLGYECGHGALVGAGPGPPMPAVTLGAMRSVCMVVGLPFAPLGLRRQARPGRWQVIACMTARLGRAAQD